MIERQIETESDSGKPSERPTVFNQRIVDDNALISASDLPIDPVEMSLYESLREQGWHLTSQIGHNCSGESFISIWPSTAFNQVKPWFNSSRSVFDGSRGIPVISCAFYSDRR
jgi:hypothetical protein